MGGKALSFWSIAGRSCLLSHVVTSKVANLCCRLRSAVELVDAMTRLAGLRELIPSYDLHRRNRECAVLRYCNNEEMKSK